MTNRDAILIIKYGCLVNIDLNQNDDGTALYMALDKAIDALFKLDAIENFGRTVCSISKKYDCSGCVYSKDKDCDGFCQICRRNCKDYYRKAQSDVSLQ